MQTDSRLSQPKKSGMNLLAKLEFIITRVKAVR